MNPSQRHPHHTMSEPTPCATCGTPTNRLELFPEDICLNCYELKMADAPMELFAQQITNTFGGKPK